MIPSQISVSSNANHIYSLGMSLFLPTAEISIVSTSLVTIAEDLKGFEQSSWIITAYLAAFTGLFIFSPDSN